MSAVPAMSGDRDLGRLLAALSPKRHPGEFVFVTAPGEIDAARLRPVATMLEAEGLTMVLERERADQAELAYDFVSAWITLGVHSALDAVGLTAAVAARVAAAGIACNIVAGRFHDHLFVPVERARETVDLLAG